MRMDYNRWCGLWVDRGAWERRVIDADRKRKRKAAKRRRDAELTRLGEATRRARLVADTGDAMRCGYMHYDRTTWADDAWDAADRAEYAMIVIRRGEVQP